MAEEMQGYKLNNFISSIHLYSQNEGMFFNSGRKWRVFLPWSQVQDIAEFTIAFRCTKFTYV